MPIYKQINSPNEEVLETIDVLYHDEGKTKAKESVVAQFGYGDIQICSSKSRYEYLDELCLQPSLEPHPIGEKGNPDDIGPIFSPIRLIFDRRESIDAVISELNVLREQFPERR